MPSSLFPRSLEFPPEARTRHGEDRSDQRGKTLGERGRAAPGESIVRRPVRTRASARGGRSGWAFSIQALEPEIPDGKTLVVLGRSGCGKTTLLRIIAGLIPPDSGEVRYDDVDVKMSSGRSTSAWCFSSTRSIRIERQIERLADFMFRRKRPNWTRWPKPSISGPGSSWGSSSPISWIEGRGPCGVVVKQRVALGRCITRDPALFLLDEPFSNLDQALREKYRVNLKILLSNSTSPRLRDARSLQALILADLVAIMNRGHIEQVGRTQTSTSNRRTCSWRASSTGTSGLCPSASSRQSTCLRAIGWVTCAWACVPRSCGCSERGRGQDRRDHRRQTGQPIINAAILSTRVRSTRSTPDRARRELPPG